MVLSLSGSVLFPEVGLVEGGGHWFAVEVVAGGDVGVVGGHDSGELFVPVERAMTGLGLVVVMRTAYRWAG